MTHTDVKYLVKKYRRQIAGWRTPPVMQSWERIGRMIADAEGLPCENQPHSSSLRRAWQGTFASHTERLEQNQPAARMDTSLSTFPNKAIDVRRAEQAEHLRQAEQNRHPTRTNPRTAHVPTKEEWESWPLERKLEEGIPVANPDGTRYMRPLKSDEAKLLQRDARAAAFDAGEL